jgi:hypothetical protein
MVDTNVFFRIRCAWQRLIELRKENWEVAVPVENHGFPKRRAGLTNTAHPALFEETFRQ